MISRAYPRTPTRRAVLGAAIASLAVAASGAVCVSGALAQSLREIDAAVTGRTAKVTTVNQTETTSGDGLELQTVHAGIKGKELAFSGTAATSDSGMTMKLQSTTTPAVSSSWKTAVKVSVASDGTYSGRWKLATIGQQDVRVELVQNVNSGQTGFGSSAPAAAHTGFLPVVIFKSAQATLYGPGFWGDQTACGEDLKRTMIGVANRTLKCGTEVAIDYHGHELVAPVIDRGPYGGKAKWDLTMATASALGIKATSNIATLAPAPK